VAQQIKVALYTLSTCPWLDNHHVTYEFVDYDLADEGLQRHIQEEMVERGASAFPFVKFGDADFIIGFNPDAFARLLGMPKEAEPAGEKPEEGSGACAADFEAADSDE